MSAAAEQRTGRFSRTHRLLNPAEFQRVFDRPVRSSDRFFTLLFASNQVDHARLGLAIAKRRVRRAVGRNRIKRIVRESFRRSRPTLPAVDIVVLSRSAAAQASRAELAVSLQHHWQTIRRRAC